MKNKDWPYADNTAADENYLRRNRDQAKSDLFYLKTQRHGKILVGEKNLLQLLETTASRLGVEIRYENLSLPWGRSQGGYCKFEGKPIIIVDRNASQRAKINIIAKGLRRMDVGNVFVPPAVRRILDSSNAHKS